MTDEEGARLLVPCERRRHGAPPETIGVDDQLALGRREPRDFGGGRSGVDAYGAIEEGHAGSLQPSATSEERVVVERGRGGVGFGDGGERGGGGGGSSPRRRPLRRRH